MNTDWEQLRRYDQQFLLRIWTPQELAFIQSQAIKAAHSALSDDRVSRHTGSIPLDTLEVLANVIGRQVVELLQRQGIERADHRVFDNAMTNQ